MFVEATYSLEMIKSGLHLGQIRNIAIMLDISIFLTKEKRT